MWCCFSANTVVEPTKLKPLAAEVQVAKKPVTLMFRLPSEDPPQVPNLLQASKPQVPNLLQASKPQAPEAPKTIEIKEVEHLENADCEIVDASCVNVYSALLALALLILLYLLTVDAENRLVLMIGENRDL
jgi:hypothetical protein